MSQQPTSEPSPSAPEPPFRTRRMLWPLRSVRIAPWVTRLILESGAIVLSILLALGFDQWAEDRDRRELAERSLASFGLEVQQNRARLDDVVPFHRGLRSVLAKLEAEGHIRTMADLRAAVGSEQIRPPFLTDVAWQTAVATGALTHIDFESVSALSLTYTLQHSFQEETLRTLPDLIRASAVSEADLRDYVRYTLSFLDDITSGEEDLRSVYEQALAVLQMHENQRRGWSEAPGETPG